MRPKRNRPEAALQMAVVKMLSCQRIEGFWWTAMRPDAYSDHWSIRNRTKNMGAKRGTPDMLFIFEGRPIAIELKADNGRVSDEQQGMAAQMERAGCPVFVARSLDAVVAILAAHGVPINGRIAA